MLNQAVKSVIFWLVTSGLSIGLLNAADDQAPLGTLTDVGGYRVHLYCTGVGGPTVMVVGGGFSFDWGLVQPEVARRTRICTYDPSGTAWSDPSPLQRTPNCSDRVAEIHEVLRHASVGGPFVIVGFSIGALYGRLYASRYPEDVGGMVIVDHAFIDPDGPSRPPSERRADHNTQPAPMRGVLSINDVDTPPSLISQTAIALGIEDDQNFERLPKRNRDLHRWAMSKHPMRPTAETAAECAAEIEKETRGQTYPLGARPLVVISTRNESPSYQRLQSGLLLLTHDGKQTIAEHSTHMVLVDAPEAIITAIDDVITSIRNRAALRK
jgi:pimeloyl-ACP methyl ester carboxylesterase